MGPADEADRAEVASYGPPPKYPIESVDNALQLLSLFLTSERIRVKDAAEMLGVATGTAHRLLAMLLYRGYVTQDPLTRVYVPGPQVLSVGLKAVEGSDLRRRARPLLEELNATLDETIHLATLLGREVLFVDALESGKALRVTSRAGTLCPAHCTSVGKAMLAEMSRAQLLDLYPDEDLPQATPRSLATKSELLLDLEATRARGYAINFGELEHGIGSVAAVARNNRDQVVAAVGAGAPMSRLDDLRIQEMGDAVVAGVRALAPALS